MPIYDFYLGKGVKTLSLESLENKDPVASFMSLI